MPRIAPSMLLVAGLILAQTTPAVAQGAVKAPAGQSANKPPAAGNVNPGVNAIRSVSASASPSTLTGQCPLNASFTGTITFAMASSSRQVIVGWLRTYGSVPAGTTLKAPSAHTVYQQLAAPGTTLTVTDGPWGAGTAQLNMPNMPVTFNAQDELIVAGVNAMGANGKPVHIMHQTAAAGSAASDYMTVGGGGTPWGNQTASASVTCK